MKVFFGFSKREIGVFGVENLATLTGHATVRFVL